LDLYFQNDVAAGMCFNSFKEIRSIHEYAISWIVSCIYAGSEHLSNYWVNQLIRNVLYCVDDSHLFEGAEHPRTIVKINFKSMQRVIFSIIGRAASEAWRLERACSYVNSRANTSIAYPWSTLAATQTRWLELGYLSIPFIRGLGSYFLWQLFAWWQLLQSSYLLQLLDDLHPFGHVLELLPWEIDILLDTQTLEILSGLN